MAPSFQSLIGENHCFGCGPDNPDGLRIESRWEDEQWAICRYQPEPHHAAGPRQFLNGGIIATLIDCHAVCTAVADAYRRAGREIGSTPALWFVTGSLSVRYLRPTPIAAEVMIRARVVSSGERESRVACVLSAAGKPRAEGEVVAVRVPPTWHSPA